jgi:hypothetical protein
MQLHWGFDLGFRHFVNLVDMQRGFVVWGEAALGFESWVALFGIGVVGDVVYVFTFLYPFRDCFIEELANFVFTYS